MSVPKNVAFAWAVWLGLTMGTGAQAQVMIAICGPEICKQDGTGHWIMLTHDGQAKETPVISPDGRTIAFSASVDERIGFARIGFVPVTGGAAKYYVFAPNRDRIFYGFRYLAGLVWASPHLLAVGGSIDPTTTQYFLFDKDTGETDVDIVDQGDSLSFSPDGVHYTYRFDHPHSGLWAGDKSKLGTDRGAVVPRAGYAINFDVCPVWSLDSRILAGVVMDQKGNALAFSWAPDTGMRIATAPITPNQAISVSSTPRGFVYHARADSGGGDFLWDGKSGSPPVMIGRTTESALPEAIAQQNLVNLADTPAMAKSPAAGNGAAIWVGNLDIWCTNCAFAALPRRVPHD